MPAVGKKLPPGFEIAVSSFDGFDFERSWTGHLDPVSPGPRR